MPRVFPSMKFNPPQSLRSQKAFVTLLLVGCAGIVGYALDARTNTSLETQSTAEESLRPSIADVGPQPTQTAAVAESIAPTPPIAAPAAKSLSANVVEKLIHDATEGDRDTRADAIYGLADAPREQAAPVLHRILIGGDVIDGHLALDALRTIALAQGDADGIVHNAVRFAVYHGTNDTITQSAQEILEELDNPRDTAKTAKP